MRSIVENKNTNLLYSQKIVELGKKVALLALDHDTDPFYVLDDIKAYFKNLGMVEEYKEKH